MSKKDSNKKSDLSGTSETDCTCDSEKNKIFTSISLDEAWAFVEISLTEIKEQKEYIDKLTETLGLEPESPLREAFYSLSDNLVQILALLVNDTDCMIEWFVYECRFGTKDLEAGCNGASRKIKTVKDLRWIIELDCSEDKPINDEKGD